MTTNDYSMFGLKDLLSDLQNLSTSLMTIPTEHVDSSAYGQLQEDQYQLIQKINCYATMLDHFEKGDSTD